MSVTPKFTPAASLVDAWEHDITTGVKPVRYPLGTGDMGNIEFGPNRVLLIGGSPGAGKTALVMQWVCHALTHTPDLRACVCNVEMSPRALLDRQLSRVSRVNLRDIRTRELDPAALESVRRGAAELRPLCDRLYFVDAPFDLGNVVATASACGAGVVVLDYLQRIKLPANGKAADKRMQLEQSMDLIRRLADADLAVIVVAAVARSKDTKGRNSYENLTLASFRESSELEYGADDAFILAASSNPANPVRLKHLKSRYGETADIDLRFERAFQTFTPFGATATPPVVRRVPPAGGSKLDAFKDAWGKAK